MEQINEISESEARDKLIQGAFIGWQMGAGGQVKFTEYIKNLGLQPKDESKLEPVEEKITAKEAIAKAEGVLEIARKKKAEKAEK